MNKPEKLLKYFKKKGLEIREKKTVIGIYHDNLQLFSINSVRVNGLDVVLNFTFNILKQNKQVLHEMLDVVNIDKTPFVNGIEEDELIRLLKKYKLVAESKELTVFSEVQSDYVLEIAEKDGKSIEFRGNLPTELHIVQAVFKSNEYVNKGLRLDETDVVFDLGGNIGCFCCEIFDRVKEVIVFEPEDVNFHFLETNIARNDATNVTPIQAAVVANDDEVRDLFLGKVPYYYSFLVKNNRKPVPVACLNINDLIAEHRPTKMKIDIEGSELEVMLGITDFDRVEQIIFEYNFDMNGDLKSGYENWRKLKKHLAKHDFDITDMEKDLKQNWNMVFLVNRV